MTFIDSKYTNSEGNKFALPGQSDKTYNLSLFYENYGLVRAPELSLSRCLA